MSKGGQTVLVCDSHRVRPCTYYHRHKLQSKPDGWTASGMVEARSLIEVLDGMVVNLDDTTTTPKFQIYDQKPHVTMDNYCSGNKVLDWIGSKGFGATMTYCRDMLPSGIPSKYLHKQKNRFKQENKSCSFLQSCSCCEDFWCKR